MSSIGIARVYDPPDGDNVLRVLADRLWPRGIAKSDAPFSIWAKDVAPSTELRKWYQHDESRFEEFAERYRSELAQAPQHDALVDLRRQVSGHDACLLSATKVLELSHLAVLREVLLESGPTTR